MRGHSRGLGSVVRTPHHGSSSGHSRRNSSCQLGRPAVADSTLIIGQ